LNTQAPEITRKGRRKPPRTPKGRQVDLQALEEVRALLTDRPRRRDLLIEHLHLIQDHYGYISAAHLTALANEMSMALAEVYEVATFYSHFDVVKEGETPPPEITIRICDSLSCAMAGAAALTAAVAAGKPANVRVLHAPCMGLCDQAPAAAVGKNYVGNATGPQLLKLAEVHATGAVIAEHQSYDAYCHGGGYETLKSLRIGSQSPDQVIEMLLAAGLRGLGGAGFPSGQKWKFVRAAKGPRYLCINGDEGEPGTFKDRHYLLSRPHQFLEGMLIAAWGVEAEKAFIYLRDEYPAAHAILKSEIARIEGEGLVAPGYIDLRRGAGAYICGEESAMIESVEGNRGLPRHRPPYVAQVGIFGRPTLVHNIETVFWMPEILGKGPDAFAALGKEGHKGIRSYSVSGRVKAPGVVVAPAGTTANELIERTGGMLDGHVFKGYLPGGASGGILPASMGDIALDFDTLQPHGCFIGSAAVVILSQHDRARDAALNLMRFFADESCGQCTPCRVGTDKAVALMQRPQWDLPLLADLSRAMADASICGLGQAAPNPIACVVKYFPHELTGNPT
jgi:formate dehydrogenase